MTKIYLMVADEQDINPANGQFKKAKGVELNQEELQLLVKSLNNLDYYEQRDCESWSDCKDGSSGLAKTEYQKIHQQIINTLQNIEKVLQCLKKQ